MTEDELVNKLRTHTPLGRFAAGEVRHVLEYMRSIGFAMDPAATQAAPQDALPGPSSINDSARTMMANIAEFRATAPAALDRTLSPLFPAKPEKAE